MSCSFNSISERSNAQASHLGHLFSDPMTGVYFPFYQATMQIFVEMNKFLQRENLIIFDMNSKMAVFMERLEGKICNHEGNSGSRQHLQC